MSSTSLLFFLALVLYGNSALAEGDGLEKPYGYCYVQCNPIDLPPSKPEFALFWVSETDDCRKVVSPDDASRRCNDDCFPHCWEREPHGKITGWPRPPITDTNAVAILYWRQINRVSPDCSCNEH